ncbi:MAG: HD domain-containing protein [Treponema sp.]|nr:HD domain-containing protein [Treponema sp.]
MAIYKPKLLILYNSEDSAFVDRFDVFFDVIKTTDSQQALKTAFKEGDSLSAVLIDEPLSVNTVDVLRKFNDFDIFRKTPSILLAENTEGTFLNRAFETGLFDVVAKPCTFEIVKQKLSKFIELYNNRNQLEKFFNQQMMTISVQEHELKENQWNIISTLGQALESRDVESGNHCERMRQTTETLCKYIAIKYPKYMLNELKTRQIAQVTPLHDIGKIAIPDRILHKPESAGRLTDEEFDIMKTHTVAGCKLIDSIPRFKESALYTYSYNICRYHHERWDGRGYPDHLKGMEIPIEAQVVAIADVFDALICKRVYKPSFTLEKTKSMILGGECGAFNPDIVESFSACIDSIYANHYEKQLTSST